MAFVTKSRTTLSERPARNSDRERHDDAVRQAIPIVALGARSRRRLLMMADLTPSGRDEREFFARPAQVADQAGH